MTQRLQMISVTDPNIHNIALDGNFDDCQVRAASTPAPATHPALPPALLAYPSTPTPRPPPLPPTPHCRATLLRSYQPLVT